MISPEKFNKKPQDRGKDQIEDKNPAGPGILTVNPQKDEHKKKAHRRIKLGRMQARVVDREIDPPSHWAPVAAPVQETPDPPDGLAQGDIGRAQVQDLQKRQTLFADKDHPGDDTADKASLPRQPSFMDHEHLRGPLNKIS